MYYFYLWIVGTLAILMTSWLMYAVGTDDSEYDQEVRTFLSRVILFCWAWPVVTVAIVIITGVKCITDIIPLLKSVIKDADLRNLLRR